MCRFVRLSFLAVALSSWGLVPPNLPAQTNQLVYSDSLQNGWVSWGWATLNFNNSAPVHAGTNSISVTCGAYQALYLHHAAFDSSSFTNLNFWIDGGVGGQNLQVQATLNGSAQPAYSLAPLTTNWQFVSIPLSALGVAAQPNLDGFWIQNTNGYAIPTFYVDDVTLQGGAPPPPPPNPTNFATVDAASNRHPISPLIYGVAFATSNQLADLNCPLNRSGGNAETRYNWQLNAHNHASDWYFESIADSPAVPAAASDSHVAASKAGGAQPILTVPMIGWAPKLTSSRGAIGSFSVAKYGPQTGADPYFSDAGNGLSSTNNNQPIVNDPNDANFSTNSAFALAWLEHLTNRWGLSTNGGVPFFCMDNEHSLWHSTHRDVHPVGATMREIRDKFFDYASVVKTADPGALVLAPEEWGWSGYFYSGYDQQRAASLNYNVSQYPDRTTNGGWDYLPWFLDQVRRHDTNSGRRLLDYFTVHYYPQSGEFGNDISTSMQQLRNRSTRSLWDTNYVDASWIGSVVQLIPRLKSWVAAYYPGTKIGITEYNWGAESNINGATAQADIFGIFGREGLDLATRWTTPNAGTPAYLAMKLFRNYDGSNSAFGDTSVSASGPNPDNVAIFAAQRSADAALTIMIVSKYLSGVTPLSLAITNFIGSGTAQVWQLNSTNAITRLADLPCSAGNLSLTVPGQSITLLVLSPRPLRLQPGARRSDGQFEFWLNGEIGQTCVVQSSTNLYSWTPVSTNTLSTSQLHLVLPGGPARKFCRALWTH